LRNRAKLELFLVQLFQFSNYTNSVLERCEFRANNMRKMGKKICKSQCVLSICFGWQSWSYVTATTFKGNRHLGRSYIKLFI